MGEKSPSILKRLKGGPEPQQHQLKSLNSSSLLPTSSQLSLSLNEGGGVPSRQGSTLSLNSTSPSYSSSSSTVRSHSSLSNYSPGVAKRSPQTIPSHTNQPERSRSLSPVPTEDLYSYRRSPLPKHRTPPSTVSTHDSTGLTSQTSLTNQHQQKVLTNGHSQHTHSGTKFAQNHVLQRRATEITPRELSHMNQAGGISLKTLASTPRLAVSIDDSPSSSPELVDSRQTSKQLRRKNRSVLTGHQYSSSPDFYASTDTVNGGTSLMKLSDKHGSSLSLSSVTSLSSSTTVTSGNDDCKHEVAVMDLYILKQSSDFYHQFCVAWMNVKIVSVH